MKIKPLKLILLTASLLLTNGMLNAQDYIDEENCKDHPFFNRLEKFYIANCTENYNEYEFIIGEDKSQTLEGTVTEILYSYAGSFGPTLPSKLQVVRNYENAILKMGERKYILEQKTMEIGLAQHFNYRKMEKNIG